MGVKTNQYQAQLTQDISRGPSSSIWGDCPVEELIQNGPAGVGPVGTYFFDDFDQLPAWALFNGERQIGKWQTWVGNNSGAVIGDGADTTNLPEEGSILGITGGTTAIDVTMAAGAGTYRPISPATGFPFGGKIWYECRVAISTVATASLDLFTGFMDRGDAAGTRITSAASLGFSATNTIKTATGNGGCIGFWKRATTNPTDWGVVYNVNNGTAQLPDSGVAATSGLQKILTNSGVAAFSTGATALTSTNNNPVANAFVKLGFIYDPTANCPTMTSIQATTSNQTKGNVYTARVRFFLNGQLLPYFLNTSDVQASTFPQTFMCPVIAYRSGGTNTGIGYVDWVRAAQLGTY